MCPWDGEGGRSTRQHDGITCSKLKRTDSSNNRRALATDELGVGERPHSASTGGLRYTQPECLTSETVRCTVHYHLQRTAVTPNILVFCASQVVFLGVHFLGIGVTCTALERVPPCITLNMSKCLAVRRKFRFVLATPAFLETKSYVKLECA